MGAAVISCSTPHCLTIGQISEIESHHKKHQAGLIILYPTLYQLAMTAIGIIDGIIICLWLIYYLFILLHISVLVDLATPVVSV